LPRWIYEGGIGENRAILVENDQIIEAALEWGSGAQAGSVLEARLISIVIPGRRGIISLTGGEEGFLEPLPASLTEGRVLHVEVVREAIPEAGPAKLAKVRVSEAPLQQGPPLRERIGSSGFGVIDARSGGDDSLERSGWSELLESAASGDIAFEGGALRMSLTPAMTLFDVDGFLPPAALATAGARAAGQAIRRFGITGSIGIDLPTLPSRTDRQAAAAALDAVLLQPFERTAVNGFGFLQVVRKRERASIPELLQGDPVGAAARALLRRAERTSGSGERTITAAPAVLQAIREDWRGELERRIGAPVALRPDASLAISAGHVQAAHN